MNALVLSTPDKIMSKDKSYSQSQISQNEIHDPKTYGVASRFKDLTFDTITVPRAYFDDKNNYSFLYNGSLNVFENFIGRGAYGDVYEGQFENKKAAAKFCNYMGADEREKKTNYMYILNEIACLHLLNHPNVIKVYAYAHNSDGDRIGELILILQHGGTTLKRLVNSRSLKSGQIINIFIQIFKGLDYIHNFDDKKFIHRDIKPENIFVNTDLTDDVFEVRIGDLGHIRNTGINHTF